MTAVIDPAHLAAAFWAASSMCVDDANQGKDPADPAYLLPGDLPYNTAIVGADQTVDVWQHMADILNMQGGGWFDPP